MTLALALRPDPGVPVPETAMVMAAGLGKRMRPLTATRPKPLVEVAGKPLIDHVFDRLRTAGVRRAVVNVHYMAAALEAHVKARARDIEVVISDERAQLMETGGGLVKAHFGWTQGLPAAAGVQANECPDGTLATLARGHEDVVRCMPI